MTLCFFGIGLGYILMQVSLLQRLMIVLGRPTLALSVVLFSTLLGTGWSRRRERLFPSGNLRRAMLMIVGALVVLQAQLLRRAMLERCRRPCRKFALVGAILFATGFVLGCAFPLGVRAVAPTGEWAIQKMWAISGAAGLPRPFSPPSSDSSGGSRFRLSAGILAYVLALVTAVVSVRLDPPVPFWYGRDFPNGNWVPEVGP